jgi:hypothetical protein
MRGSLIAIFVAISLTIQVFPETALPQETDQNGFYCVNGPAHKGMYSFALKERDDKTLDFGVSLWWPDGKNVAIIGLARHFGNGWRYEDLGYPEHCVVNIVPENGGYSLTINQASCQGKGGFQAVPAKVVFTKAMKQGPAGNLLANAETFWNAKCNARPGVKSPPRKVGW